MKPSTPVKVSPKSRANEPLRGLLALFFFLVLLQTEGCYYAQAVRGHVGIMQKRRPIDEIILDADSPPPLKERLTLLKEARRFAIDQLLLPDNDSYQSYADLGRDYAAWNVFAAPEFAVQPKRWCYPVAGCVAYRGYFSKDAAERKANQLVRAGLDVALVGVSAYSTLGRFADPVLSTMMRWSDLELIGVLFHELAHQKLYVKGDAEFNESFASTVEEAGIERWLIGRPEADQLHDYRSRREVMQRLADLVRAARAGLDELYASRLPEAAKRAQKQTILVELGRSLRSESASAGQRVPSWLDAPLNNASLIPITIYEGRVGEFRALLKSCNNELQCFYEKAERLSRN